MSSMNIAQYFFPRQVKIMEQSFYSDSRQVVISMRPDYRLSPYCSRCGARACSTHDTTHRFVRDLNMTTTTVWLNLFYRKVYCPACEKTRVEGQAFVEPYTRVTKRLARYIHDLCKTMTVKAVAKHMGLDWKTVKNIDKTFLEEGLGKTDYEGLRILVVDELAIRKGHDYVTVLLDYETGRIVWIGEERSTETLDNFFKKVPEEVRRDIVAVATDMWRPYVIAIKKWCPEAKIVYDLFHVVRDFGRIINEIRSQEYRKADEAGKAVLKGARYVLLKNRENLKEREVVHLKKILEMNKTLSTAYILKDYLKEIYRCKDKEQARMALEQWYSLAGESKNAALIKYARKLERNSERILNHCIYSIHTGTLEGTNNTLKVIKRRAYGFHDIRYFILKCKQAFPGIRVH